MAPFSQPVACTYFMKTSPKKDDIFFLKAILVPNHQNTIKIDF